MSCKRSLINELSPSSKEYKQEYNRLYRLAHPEMAIKASRKYRNTNLKKVKKTARAYARRIRKEQPDEMHRKDRIWQLKKNYGITTEQYDDLLKQQGGVCAICGGKQQGHHNYLCVDHDHKTGAVRGLLCHRCNTCLGRVDDNLEILQMMMNYIKIDAAKAYNTAAQKHFKEFGKLNKI